MKWSLLCWLGRHIWDGVPLVTQYTILENCTRCGKEREW